MPGGDHPGARAGGLMHRRGRAVRQRPPVLPWPLPRPELRGSRPEALYDILFPLSAKWMQFILSYSPIFVWVLGRSVAIYGDCLKRRPFKWHGHIVHKVTTGCIQPGSYENMNRTARIFVNGEARPVV